MSGRLLKVTNNQFRNVTGIKICTDHTGKMKGLWSLSVSPNNKLCEKKSIIPDSICSHCYSRAMQRVYSDLDRCLQNNLEILTTKELDENEMPDLSNKLNMFRFESFGDVVEALQVVNYFKISDANPTVDCALWTKNPWIIMDAMKKYGISKPENLTIIGSSYYLNKPMEEFYRKYDFIDYIFTVYDSDYIETNNININCGGRSCESCKKCYRRTHDGYEIREKLK